MLMYLPLALAILWRRIPWWHLLVAFWVFLWLLCLPPVVVFGAVVFGLGGIVVVVVVVRLFTLGGIVAFAIIILDDRDRVTTRIVLVVAGDGKLTATAITAPSLVGAISISISAIRWWCRVPAIVATTATVSPTSAIRWWRVISISISISAMVRW
jgi:hypothetical protein